MKIYLNGVPYEARDGQTILEVARDHGINIPTLCNYDGFENGVCRLCMVQIGGSERLVPSCSTRAMEGMEIVTESKKLASYRSTLLSLIMSNHGNHSGDEVQKCQLHHEYEKAGGQNLIGLREAPEVELIDESHPALRFNPSLCIECRKCVIACSKDQINGVIQIGGFGSSVHIIFDDGSTFGDSSCVSCGACADVCPTGAIIENNWTPAERTVISTCPYCAVGCQIEYGIAGNKIVWARGADGTNDRKLCVKGKFGYEFEMSSDRLLYPLLRKNGVPRGPLKNGNIHETFERISWDKALDIISSKIRDVRERYGANAIAAVGSDRSTNEDVYALQKLMRAVVGTDNIDQSATLCHSPSAAMLSYGLGAGAATNPIHDVLNSKTIMVVGSNTDRAHPVLSSFIKRASLNGSYLIVVDPIRVELAELADSYLQIRPGTDAYLFSTMARYIYENGLYDKKFVEENTEDFDAYVESLRNFSLEKAEFITGIPKDEMIKIARIYAENKPSSIYWTLGITEHENGSDNVSSLVNLAILTGNIGISGGGANPIRGQNNVQGGADVGGIPGSLPGYQNLLDDRVRTKFEADWKIKLPDSVGYKSTEMIINALKGNLKMMYISGENSLRSHPNSSEAKKAIMSLEFLVVQDIFLTETAEYADLILPAASVYEKTGTFTNTERRVQMVRKIFDPPGEAKPDWQIYSAIAEKLGYGFSYRNTSDIMNEISRLVPTWSGISHERLESGGLQWPVRDSSSDGTYILHADGIMRGKARFRPISWTDKRKDGYPYVLITGRRRELYHTSTMTSRSSVLNRIQTGAYLELNKGDMEKENLSENEYVLVESSTGSIRCHIRSNERIPSGVAFTTFHYRELDANALTPSDLDPITKTPAYKDTRIRIKKL